MNPQDEQPTNPTQPSNFQPSPAPTEPESKKNIIIVIAVVVAVIILGIVAFAMLSPKKDSSKTSNSSESTSSNENTNPASDKYQKYEVTDKTSGATFSISFYKDAKVEEKNGRTYLNSGETGSMYSVYLGVAAGDTIDCGKSPTTTMTLGGKSTTVCYMADNTQYAGYVNAKSGAVKLNLAGQKPISIDEAKEIMESISFK